MQSINTISRRAVDDLLGVIATNSRHAEQALQQAGLLSSLFDTGVSEVPQTALWRLTESISRLEMIFPGQTDQHRKPSIRTLPQSDGFERKPTTVNTARIQALINYQVLGGKPSIRGLADALGMSVRTLQRRLAEHDINYADTVTKCRLELAKEQLASSELRISEIAYGLGYKHPNDFSRAFSRNMNCSP